MTYPDLDTQRLSNLEQNYDVKCNGTLPFSPADIVEWKCNPNVPNSSRTSIKDLNEIISVEEDKYKQENFAYCISIICCKVTYSGIL